MVFSLKTCGHTSILLSANTHSLQEGRVIEFNDDSGKTTLTDSVGGRVVAETSETTVVCDEFRPFWIFYGSENFYFGKGMEIGMNPLFQWTDLNPFVMTAMSFDSHDGNVASWDLPQNNRYSKTTVLRSISIKLLRWLNISAREITNFDD